MPDFVTYSRNLFIPVTNVCRNKCGYCGFRRDPDDPQAHLMPIEDVVQLLEKGKNAGCSEVLFTFGEYAEYVPKYREWLMELGYSTTLEYVAELCKISIEIGILPHTNAGILSSHEMETLKPLNASMGLMLESATKLKAHKDCPGKAPETRLKMIRDAGKLKIPFTTGILVGIGESMDDRAESLHEIANIHKKYGHIQEVIIQNFMPKPNTPMADRMPATKEEMTKTVTLARRILPDDVVVQVAPNLIDPYLLIQCGASDLGGISNTTIDWINPEAEWPSVLKLKEMVREHTLRERLPIYPQYIKNKWYHSNLADLIESLADQDGYRKTE